MQFLWKWIDDLVGKGLELLEIGELLFYASVRFVPLALPISMLLASVMTFGAFGEKSELVAMKSAGISLKRMMSSLFIFVLFISIGSFSFSNYVMPVVNLKSGSLLYAIQKQKPSLNIKAGVFYNGIEGYSIKIEEKSDDGNLLKNILIYNHTSRNGNNNILIAKSGSMRLTKDEKFLEFKLFDGYNYSQEKDKRGKRKNNHKRIKFKEDIILFNLSEFEFKRTSVDLYKGHYAMLNNLQLSNAIDSLNKKLLEKKALIKESLIKNYNFNLQVSDSTSFPTLKSREKIIQEQRIYDFSLNKIRSLKSIAKTNKSDIEYRDLIITKHKIEWHRKIALAVACFIFFLIGVPLGTIIRKGGFGLPVMFSILFFIFYHVINIIGEKSSKEGTLEPFEGMWIANIIFFPISIILIYITTKNISLFDASRFSNSFNKLFNNN